MSGKWNRRSAILAAAVVGAFSAGANATTLYVANYGNNEIQQFPNAPYGGSVTVASASNNFASLTNGIGVTVDSVGNVVADQYNSTGSSGGAVAYSPTGSVLASSSTFGSENYASPVIFNNSLYVPEQQVTNTSIVQLSYTLTGATPAFGAPTTLSTNTLGDRSLALAVIPAGAAGNTTGNSYLVYSLYNISSQSTTLLNALNLSNNNSIALATPPTMTNSTTVQSLVFDPRNGDLYGCGNASDAVYQVVPQYIGGTLSGFTTTNLTSLLTTGSGSGLNVPVGMAFGPDNNLYIAEDGSNEIDEVNIDGTGSGTADQLNEYIDLGSGAEPFGIAFTPEPSSLSLLVLSAVPLLRRRRRQ